MTSPSSVASVPLLVDTGAIIDPDIDSVIDPTTSIQMGSITYDWNENSYNLEWESRDDFDRWLTNEQEAPPPASIATISRGAPNARACYVQSLSLPAPSSPSVSANVFLFSGGRFFGSPILSRVQFIDLHLLPLNVAQ